ncbi:Potassium transporter 5 [Asimina triloba]
MGSQSPSYLWHKDWATILALAFQSIGVVYGDIGTSPLYVYSSTFTGGIQHNDDILGVLSMIFYTLTLIPLIKYVLIVLHANDQGDGGTFALYSLICRYAKVNLIPSQQAEDRELSHYQLDLPSRRQIRASRVKSALENSHFAKYALLLLTMLGTSMVMGDGVLTPCISVLSSVGGIKQATTAMTEVLHNQLKVKPKELLLGQAIIIVSQQINLFKFLNIAGMIKISVSKRLGSEGFKLPVRPDHDIYS